MSTFVRLETDDSHEITAFLFLLDRLALVRRSSNILIDLPQMLPLRSFFCLPSSTVKGRLTYSMPCPCRTHAIPLPCRAAKGLECVFPLWFTQCSRVWFTLAMLRPCRSSQGHNTAWPSRDGRAVAWPWEERHGQSGAWAWHGRGTAWARHDMCEMAFNLPHTRRMTRRWQSFERSVGSTLFGQAALKKKKYIYIYIYIYMHYRHINFDCL